MSPPLNDQRAIVSILLIQAALGMVAAGPAALWLGPTVAISWLVGCGIAVIPNAFLAARLLAPGSARSAKALLNAAWLGEIGKLVLTAALFAAAFVAIRPLSVPAVFAGYIAAQWVIIGAPLLGGRLLDGTDGRAER